MLSIATELLEFGSLANESLYESDFANGKFEDGAGTSQVNGDLEDHKKDEDESFTPAGSQFGEIGERIRSAKASSRIRPKEGNPMILPLNNHN